MGMMVNYVYEPDMIEGNHEQFVAEGRVAYSAEVGDLLLKRKLRGANGRASVREPQAIDTR
jgi:hypothetical protein